jgi:hypothetical protein
MLDRVVDVVRRDLDCQPDAILRQLFDLRLHPAIQAEHFRPTAQPRRGIRR